MLPDRPDGGTRGARQPASRVVDLLLEARAKSRSRDVVPEPRGIPAPLEHDFRISPDASRYYKSAKASSTGICRLGGQQANRILFVFVPW